MLVGMIPNQPSLVGHASFSPASVFNGESESSNQCITHSRGEETSSDRSSEFYKRNVIYDQVSLKVLISLLFVKIY